MSSNPTPLQLEQIHLALSAVVISTLSVSCLPELVVYLVRRWMSCNIIDTAFLWVPVVKREIIPLTQTLIMGLRQHHGIDTTSAEEKIATLEDATERYALSSRTKLLGTKVLWRCLLFLLAIAIGDWQRRSFSPLRLWSGRGGLVAKAKEEIIKVMSAQSVSINASA